MRIKKFFLLWPWIFAFIAVASHLLIHKNFFQLPLVEDETYYGNLAVLNSLLNWAEYSFGHPPGWHFLHALLYKTLGAKPETVRLLGLSFSTGLLLLIFALGWFRKQMLAASVIMLMVASHEYVRDFGSFNHPVIATSLFGFAALFLADRKKWLAFSLTLAAAIAIRESALAFVIASLFLMDSKKQLKYLILPCALFAGTYIWCFIAESGLLLNGQVKIMLESGQAPFTFSLDKLNGHINLILQLFPVSFILLALIGVPAIHSSRKFTWTPLASALLTVFFLHAVFFGLYTELGLRITFIAGMALCFLVFHWLETEPQKHWVKPFVLLLAGIVTSAQLTNWAQNPTQNLLALQDSARIHRSLSGLLKPLIRRHQDLIIMTTNPYHSYLETPAYGYTDESIVAHWYGGSPGFMELRDFDVGLVHQPMQWWPEHDIFKYTQDNGFELYHEIQGDSSRLQIWVRPGIKP